MIWPKDFSNVASIARHYRVLLRSCARHSALDAGQKLHAIATTSGLLAFSSPNAFLRNTLLHFYASCGEYVSARKLFDEIPQYEKDTVDWTILMNCHDRLGLHKESLLLFVDMRRLGVPVDEITIASLFSACAKICDERFCHQGFGFLIKFGLPYNLKACNAAINMYVKCGLMREAKKIFYEMNEKSIVSWTVILEGTMIWEGLNNARALFDLIPEKNEVAWTIMVVGYVSSGPSNEAFRLLKEMIFAYGFRLNFVTLCSLLRACTHLKDVLMGKWVHVYALKVMDEKLDVMVATALIDMYSKCGNINTAITVFKEMPCRNLVMWNALLSGLAMHGKGNLVLQMFNEMIKEVKPDELTFTAVLSACSHSGLVDEGRVIFSNLETIHGIKPSIEHYACVVDLLGRAGHLEEAESLILKMPMQPNEFVLGSLLGSCSFYEKLELGEKLMQELTRIYPENTEYHLLLSNMYASEGKYEEADSLRGALKLRGLRKVPGTSAFHSRARDGDLYIN